MYLCWCCFDYTVVFVCADIFKAHNVQGTETATFSMDDWMERTIYS